MATSRATVKNFFIKYFSSLNLKETTLLAIFLPLFGTWGVSIHYTQRWGVMTFMALLFGLMLCKRYGLLVGFTAAYCLGSAIYAAAMPDSALFALGLRKPLLDRGVLLGTISACLAWVVVHAEVLERKTFAKLFLWFGFFVSVHYFFLSGLYAPDGLLMTPTVGAIYLAFLIPLACEFGRSHLLWIIPSVCLMSGIAGWMTLFGLVLGYLAFVDGAIASVIAFMSGGAAWLWFHNGGWTRMIASGRDKHRGALWEMTWQWLQTQDWTVQWFGVGAGTWYQHGPWLQQEFKVLADGQFVYTHNEYLQGIFELGKFGMILIAAIYLRSLFRTYRKHQIHGFAFLCGLALASVSMFPLRHEVLMLLVVFQLHAVFLTRPLRRTQLT